MKFFLMIVSVLVLSGVALFNFFTNEVKSAPYTNTEIIVRENEPEEFEGVEHMPRFAPRFDFDK